MCIGFGFFRAQAAKKQYRPSGLRPEMPWHFSNPQLLPSHQKSADF